MIKRNDVMVSIIIFDYFLEAFYFCLGRGRIVEFLAIGIGTGRSHGRRHGIGEAIGVVDVHCRPFATTQDHGKFERRSSRMRDGGRCTLCSHAVDASNMGSNGTRTVATLAFSHDSAGLFEANSAFDDVSGRSGV
jgi:hypothetical protein